MTTQHRAGSDPLPSLPARLTFPAPSRQSVRTGTREEMRKAGSPQVRKGGRQTEYVEWKLVERKVQQPLYVTQPWELDGVLRTVSTGGWFDFTITVFASPDVALFAREAQAAMQVLREPCYAHH